MRFGSKGVESRTVILIFAIIVCIALLIFLWSRGMLPFLGAADKSNCLRQLADGCNAGTINAQGDEVHKVDKGCTIFPDINNYCVNCISNGCVQGDQNTGTNFNNCCSWVRGVTK